MKPLPKSPQNKALMGFLAFLILVLIYFHYRLEKIEKSQLIQNENFYTSVVRAKRIEVLNENGKVVANLGASNKGEGFLRIYGDHGEALRLHSNKEGHGFVGLLHQGELTSYMGTSREGTGMIGVNQGPQNLISLVNDGGEGRILAWNQNNQTYDDLAPLQETLPRGTWLTDFSFLDHDLTYQALYLPQTYVDTHAHPILFFFSPKKLPSPLLELCQSVADQLGWVIALLQPPTSPESFPEFVKKLERDAHKRLAIQRGRYYVCGFYKGSLTAFEMIRSFSQHVSGAIFISPPFSNQSSFTMSSFIPEMKRLNNFTSVFLVNEHGPSDIAHYAHHHLQYGGSHRSLLKSWGAHDFFPPSRLLKNVLYDLEMTWLLTQNQLNENEINFVEKSLSSQLQKIAKLKNSWDRFFEFSLLHPWTQRLNVLTKSMQQDFKSHLDDFNKLKQHPDVLEELPAQKLLLQSMIQDFQNPQEYQRALDALETLVKTHPQSQASDLAQTFISLLQQSLEKN